MTIAITILSVIVILLSLSLMDKTRNLIKINTNLRKENKELKRLRQQEVHNNTVLLNKNRELIKTITEAHDIIFSKKTLPDKEDKLKELLSK